MAPRKALSGERFKCQAPPRRFHELLRNPLPNAAYSGRSAKRDPRMALELRELAEDEGMRRTRGLHTIRH